jgi:multiple sugar transport system ATP-binding protein
MRGGFLQQVDSPQRLYERPANLFVAEFIGSPAMNLVLGKLLRKEHGPVVDFGEHSLRIPETIVNERTGLASYVDRDVVLGIRPEDMYDADLATEPAADQLLEVVTDIREDMGSEVYLHFSVHAQQVEASEVTEALEHEEFQAIEERARREGIPFIARVERQTRAREGEALRLLVDVEQLYFFDPETGAGIYAVLP